MNEITHNFGLLFFPLKIILLRSFDTAKIIIEHILSFLRGSTLVRFNRTLKHLELGMYELRFPSSRIKVSLRKHSRQITVRLFKVATFRNAPGSSGVRSCRKHVVIVFSNRQSAIILFYYFPPWFSFLCDFYRISLITMLYATEMNSCSR